MTNPNRLSRGEVVVGALDVDTGITDTDWVQFRIAPGGANAVARLRWNDTDGTLDLVMKGGNVTQQIGLEQYTLAKHADNSGLTKGKVVYFVGADGSNTTVRYAQADSDANSANTLGIVTETVSGGGKGYVTTFGMVHDIDTANLTEGAIAWLDPDTPGAMTTTKPTAPDHLVQVGFVVRSHATTGHIFVSVQNGYELDELHNVHITNPQDGQVLKYDATAGYWKNANP